MSGPFHDPLVLPDTETRVCYGCIRLDNGVVNADGTFASGKGVYLHTNDRHLTVGIIEARIRSNGALRVVFDGTPQIGSVNINGDETTAERHLSFGVTGGPSAFDVWFYKGSRKLLLNVQGDYDEVRGEYHNLWATAHYCTVRGVGLPAKADRALAEIEALKAEVAELRERVVALETAGSGS